MSVRPATTTSMSCEGARIALQTALSELERTIFAMGYDAGFAAGWDAALQRLTSLSSEKPEPRLPIAAVFNASAKDVVFRVIQQSPGLRGTEIVKATAKAGTPLDERNVRTALHRLKGANRIKNVDNRWFAAADGGQANS